MTRLFVLTVLVYAAAVVHISFSRFYSYGDNLIIVVTISYVSFDTNSLYQTQNCSIIVQISRTTILIGPLNFLNKS